MTDYQKEAAAVAIDLAQRAVSAIAEALQDGHRVPDELQLVEVADICFRESRSALDQLMRGYYDDEWQIRG